MMTLANYISDLLYRYDCVIVPNFGGFVTNRIGAKINVYTHTFYPPTKQITFNSLLKHSDGLLANYIASSENISFEKATNIISLAVVKWQNEIQLKSINFGDLGSLSLNEHKKIIFEPSTNINYLTASFGLSTVASSAINRYKEQALPIVPLVQEEKRKWMPVFIKYAATAAILLTLGTIGYQQNKQKELYTHQQKEIQKKIQSATFVISNPLPTIELNVTKKIVKPYHIIAGAFQFLENAKKKINQLQKRGYDAKIIGVNKWGLTQVSFASFADKNDAINTLYKIQDTISKDAWLFVEKVD